jgi:hypothetical protein
MAEEAIKNEVELDTDDAQETNVSFEEKAESSHPSEIKKEDVDLGYTDISELTKQKTEKAKAKEEDEVTEEQPQKKTSDDLEGYSDKVQKRIKDLTFKYREAERREQAAMDYAQGLKKKYEDIEQKYNTVDENYIKEYDGRIEAEKAKVKTMLKEAIDAQDAEKIMEANEALTRLAVEKEKVKISQSEREERAKAAKEQAEKPQEENQPQKPQKVSPRAQEWASENEWFGSDKVMTSAAMGLHDELMGEGFDAESDAYYNEINKRIRDYFPHKFADTETQEEPRRPVQNVAGVSRKQNGRRSVKLTKSQVAIAKKLGVPLEEYAKYVKEGK